MALNTKGIGTAVKQDSVQFFLGVASNPTKFNDYFLKTNKVANIRTTGDMQRTHEQTEATCLDSERKLNVSGFEEATTMDFTLAVVAGAQEDIETWYRESTQLVYGYVAFDNNNAILFAKGGTCTLGSATITGAQPGNLIETQCQLNIETIHNFADQPVTPGGVDAAG